MMTPHNLKFDERVPAHLRPSHGPFDTNNAGFEQAMDHKQGNEVVVKHKCDGPYYMFADQDALKKFLMCEEIPLQLKSFYEPVFVKLNCKRTFNGKEKKIPYFDGKFVRMYFDLEIKVNGSCFQPQHQPEQLSEQSALAASEYLWKKVFFPLFREALNQMYPDPDTVPNWLCHAQDAESFTLSHCTRLDETGKSNKISVHAVHPMVGFDTQKSCADFMSELYSKIQNILINETSLESMLGFLQEMKVSHEKDMFKLRSELKEEDENAIKLYGFFKGCFDKSVYSCTQLFRIVHCC